MKKLAILGIFCISLLGCVSGHHKYGYQQPGVVYYGYGVPYGTPYVKKYHNYEEHHHHKKKYYNPYYYDGPYRKKRHHHHDRD